MSVASSPSFFPVFEEPELPEEQASPDGYRKWQQLEWKAKEEKGIKKVAQISCTVAEEMPGRGFWKSYCHR